MPTDPYLNGLPRPNRTSPSAVYLQRELKRNGFMPTSVAEASNYGSQTQAAVARFHNRYTQFRAPGSDYDPVIGRQGWAFLRSLNVSTPAPTPTPTPTPVPTPTPSNSTLRGAGAAKGITMGAAVADHLLSNNTAKTVLAREYGSVTAENVMKWGIIHPQRDTYNWAPADRLVNFAQANGQKVHGHTLLWHTEMPGWAGPNDLEPHIRAVVGRYKGKVHSWDVVNEVMGDDSKLRNVWYRDLVAKAFRVAHEVDPNAILYINDYNIEDGRPKSDAMYNFVKGLLADGVPIHGVGFQCHFHTGWTPSTSLETQMKRFAALGLRVSITEFDCAVKNGGTLTTQATHYGNMMKAALAVGPKFDKFITWGFTDASTWLPGQQPLPFNANYEKKPAYNSLLSTLNGGAVVTPPPTTPPVVTPIGGTVNFHTVGPGKTDVAGNKIVQTALNREFGGVAVDGNWGPQTSAAYRRWQQTLGYPGDGKPGEDSLKKLGAKYGFAVSFTAPPAPAPGADKEPAHNYARTTYGGRTVNQRTKDMLTEAARLYGKPIRLTQGSYNRGVGASAGTHDGGGVVDIASSDYNLQLILRKVGFAAWVRTPPAFDYHIHAVAIGDREMSSAAKGQIQQWREDRNGLANRARDPYADPYPAWTNKYR